MSASGDQRVHGVLSDSGGVLVGPRGGRRDPRYDFERIVLAHHPGTRAGSFPEAFAAGQRVLDAGTATASRTDYHRAMLRALGVDEPSAAIPRELEAPADGPVLGLFPEARHVLDTMRAWDVRMAVVSGNWAGMEVHYRQVGIEGYLEGFVVSEVLGCRKPDPRMYTAGSDLLGLAPGDCLFVDDDPALVAAAISLGYQGVALLRGVPPPAGIPAVDTLDELLPIVAAGRPPSGITRDPAAHPGHNRDHGEGS